MTTLVLLAGFFLLKDRVAQHFQPPVPYLISLDKNDINRIEITAADQTTRLEKSGKQWSVTDKGNVYPADPQRVKEIINALLNIRKDGLVSINKNHQSEFGFGKQAVRLKTKTAQVSLTVGDNAGMDQNYIRRNQDNQIYLATGLTGVFSPGDYRDLNLHLFADETKVKQIQLIQNGQSLELKKNHDQWFVNGKAAQREKVDYFINDLKTLKASDMLTQSAAPSLGEPAGLTIIVTTDQEIRLQAYYQDQDHYWVTTNRQNYVYSVPAAYIAGLQKKEADFTQ